MVIGNYLLCRDFDYIKVKKNSHKKKPIRKADAWANLLRVLPEAFPGHTFFENYDIKTQKAIRAWFDRLQRTTKKKVRTIAFSSDQSFRSYIGQ